MAISTVGPIERSVQKAREWVKEVADELGTDDREIAWRVLRHHVSDGEVDQVLSTLPGEIRQVLEPAD